MNKVIISKGKKQAYYAIPQDFSLRMVAEDLEDLFISLPENSSFKEIKKKIETFAGLIPIKNKPAFPAVKIVISKKRADILITIN